MDSAGTAPGQLTATTTKPSHHPSIAAINPRSLPPGAPRHPSLVVLSLGLLLDEVVGVERAAVDHAESRRNARNQSVRPQRLACTIQKNLSERVAESARERFKRQMERSDWSRRGSN